MDAAECSDSQSTNEDPTFPGSDAEEAAIIVVPENAQARLAFSEVAEWLGEQNQMPSVREAQDIARKCIWVARSQKKDPEVTRLLRHFVSGALSSSSPMSSPQQEQASRRTNNPPEPVVELWHGFYYLTLGEPPQQPWRGWTVGSLRVQQSLNDVVLCLRSDNNAMYGVRPHQALFQLHMTGRFCLQQISKSSATYLGSNLVSREQHVLNEPSMMVTFGALSYRVQYARFSHSENYRSQLVNYLKEHLKTPITSADLSLTPTPSDMAGIRVGQWHLTTGTIGSGVSGRVSIGTNISGTVVALKRMTVDKGKVEVRPFQEKLETLSSLVESHNENRILRLVEVITDDARGVNRTADLWFVLTPAVADTLYSISVKGLLGDGKDR
ncbi:putative AC transposase [Purpureocillium lavendulum]|uniref:AC transposase n=1 Tax=Purpureocillium lavendulum TaxID=1247861 RepID=A0AB34FDG4_9HYPO|nr:putative AC transposase [Purpureocillium lavendulum]